MKRHELSEFLLIQSRMVEPYPKKVVPVEDQLNLTGFFPGKSGLWLEDDVETPPDILVLGQDFSTLRDYKKLVLKNAFDEKHPLWEELILLFNTAGLDLDRCFFSNVFMGLRIANSSFGPFPGAKDKDFMNRNLAFLACQIETIRPKMIITLGRPAAKMLAMLSLNLEVSWSQETFSMSQGYPRLPIVLNVAFQDHLAVCVPLDHRPKRKSFIKVMPYENEQGKFFGDEAEIELLKDSLKIID